MLVFCACYIYVLVSQTQKDLESYIDLHIESIRGVASVVQEQTSSQYRKRIKSFLNYNTSPNRENILKSFARQDREELLRLTTPFLNLFRDENPYFSTFSWILPDNKIFLLVHNPKKFDVDISKMRPDIVSANREHRTYAGFASSPAGMQYRIVRPVTYKGQHLGVLHFGLNDNLFIDAIHEKLKIPVGLVMPNEKYRYIKHSKIPSITGPSYSIQSHQIDLFRQGNELIDWSRERQRVVLQDKPHILVNVIEMNNYADELQGHIFVALDISKHVSRARSHILFILALSTVLMLVTFLILYFSYDTLSKKIIDLKVVERVNRKLEGEVAERTKELQKALDEIKTLEGILPLCSFCKKIRNDVDEWEEVDEYIHTNSQAAISHTVCPRCMKKHYPEMCEDIGGRR